MSAEVTQPQGRARRMQRELERAQRKQCRVAIALVVAGVIEVLVAGALTWSSCGHGGSGREIAGGQRR